MDYCIPAKDRFGETAKQMNGIRIMRQIMIWLHGPRPDGLVIRHLCENDSMARGGFVCVNPAHMEYATQKDNVADQMVKTENIQARKDSMLKNRDRSGQGGRAAGPVSCAIKYTCPTCGSQGTGPSHIRYHGKFGERCVH